ncbi:MAG TPA: sulfotransferase, partial [Actinomycetota bacterium]
MDAKILYIAGSGRSGSTILDNILGQIDGFVSVGEVRFVWERGVVEDRTCACGQPFSQCPFWRGVLADAGVDRPEDAQRMLHLLAHGTRARQIPRMMGPRSVRHRFVRQLHQLAERLSGVYRAIGDRSQARVIVDSSKLPTYGWWLQQMAGVDLRVVHLVRDPRATAYSWRRKKALPDKREGGFMQQQGPLKASGLWTLWNATAQIFWRRSGRYLRVRYEDFVRDP